MKHEKFPKGYRKIDSIDLEKDKRTKRTVNLLAMILAVGLAMLGYQLRGFDASASELLGKTWVLLVLLGVLFVFMLVHELTHGIVMGLLSGTKSRYISKSIYMYAGSDACFTRRNGIIFTLAPAVIWGVILAVLALVLPKNWFWLVHIVQIANIAGAAGDFYSVAAILHQPKDALIQNLGTEIKFYAPENGK